MKEDKKPIANPHIVLREEFDDWAVLFDPDAGKGFGLNPIGVYLWKLLDGKHSTLGMLERLRQDADGIPEQAADHISEFTGDLVRHGLAGYDPGQPHNFSGSEPHPPRYAPEKFSYGARGAGQQMCGALPYERPRLETFGLDRGARGTNCNAFGSHANGCGAGTGPSTACTTGHAAGYSNCFASCGPGAGLHTDCCPGTGPSGSTCITGNSP